MSAVTEKISEHAWIHQVINNATSFTSTINISFIPKKMIVRYCNYRHTAGDAGLSLLRCHALIKGGEGILTTISDAIVCPMSEFVINGPVTGLYTFEIIDCNGNLDNSREGSLAIDLEFIN